MQNSTAIWNDHCVDLANRQAWLAERHAQGYPVLVAIDELGRVAGYASFGPWRPTTAFVIPWRTRSTSAPTIAAAASAAA